jgi:uncharacterized protein YbcC (UPF0753/DUF2309 family)
VQGVRLTTPGVQSAARARLRLDLEWAARLLAPMWPLPRFVAVNPLMGLLALGFDGAVREAGRWLPLRGYPSPRFMKDAYSRGRVTDADLVAVLVERGEDSDQALPLLHAWLRDGDAVSTPGAGADPVGPSGDAASWLQAIDAQVAAFCCAFADEGGSGWGLAERRQGLYRCWRSVAGCDPLLRRHRRRLAQAVAALPADPEDAILNALAHLHIAEDHRPDELRRHLVRLPGWASYARWRQEWAEPDCPSPPFGVADLLAVQLSYEALLLHPGAVERNSPPTAADDGHPYAAIWLEAYERHYRDDLLARLASGRERQEPAVPRAQIVFCIDARSERLRRQLEATGPYTTLGFAGFFGFPVAVAAIGDRAATARCPVLMLPRGVVRERPAPGEERAAARWLRRRTRAAAVQSAWHAAKTVPGAPFSLVEALGWWLWPAASLRTLFPRGPRVSAPATMLDPADPGGLPLDARTLFAHNALLSMGLVRGFAPLVVLCGHAGQTAANPHAAALDCGACAGAPGGPSARVAARACNDPAVRAGLAARGIRIPPDSWFVAAEHDTTTDHVAILDRHLIPARHAALLEQLEADLAAAGRRCAAERALTLPGAPLRAHARQLAAHLSRRAADWAQVRPEWGLARNAALVIGPRSLTAPLDLQGRVFLHSYEPDLDADGSILEGILTGPLVVAQWINAQYYFSAVAPDVFGAGDKTLHNPVGGIGVLLGEGRDLKIGLPWQSVAAADRLYHEPMRLLVVIQAPLEHVDAVVLRNNTLRQLVDGQWLQLAARSPADMRWYVRRQGMWHRWTHATAVREARRADTDEPMGG